MTVGLLGSVTFKDTSELSKDFSGSSLEICSLNCCSHQLTLHNLGEIKRLFLNAIFELKCLKLHFAWGHKSLVFIISDWKSWKTQRGKMSLPELIRAACKYPLRGVISSLVAALEPPSFTVNNCANQRPWFFPSSYSQLIGSAAGFVLRAEASYQLHFFSSCCVQLLAADGGVAAGRAGAVLCGGGDLHRGWAAGREPAWLFRAPDGKCLRLRDQ